MLNVRGTILVNLPFLSPDILSICLSVLQLRLTVAEAVGSMCHLMASEKLEEQIPKLMPAILSLYKKNNEHYIISKVGLSCAQQAFYCGFCMVNNNVNRRGTLCICNLSLIVSVIWMRGFLPPFRVSAKCLMLLSTWAAGCWRHSWTMCLLHCINRYTLGSH